MTLRIVAIASPSKPTSVIVNTSPSVSALRPGAQTPSESVVRARTPAHRAPWWRQTRTDGPASGQRAPTAAGALTCAGDPGLWSTTD